MQGLRYRVQGSGFRFHAFWLRVQGLSLKVLGLGSSFEVQDSEFGDRVAHLLTHHR